MDIHDLMGWLGDGAAGLHDPGQLLDLLAAHGVDAGSMSNADLGALVDQFFPEEAAAGAASSALDLRFGGLKLVQAIADSQGCRPICATETIENVFQTLIGDVGGVWNGLSDHLQQVAAANGWGYFQDGGIVLLPEHYHDVLNYLGVSSHWYAFDTDGVAAALDTGRPVAAFLDASWLGYPSGGAHAITLTDVIRDGAGRLAGFAGIDSNFPGVEQTWSVDQIAGGVRSLQFASRSWWAGNILIPDTPACWPFLG
jgi:hypothetical protein